ncbi:MAG: threonine ammonia-lyase [Bdellovibrionales bacterium]|nr:threonine ammonia-lyase [Bdellovibrionales bacterium]
MDKLFDHIKNAQKRIQPSIFRTSLLHGTLLSRELGITAWCKWENRHVTGSFKERGASNFLSLLSPEDRKRGVIASSAGNHALALSYHASLQNISCKIVMPRFAPLIKVRSSRGYGADVILAGDNFDEAGEHASIIEKQENRVRVQAFNDPSIIAGQGTIGLEILDQLPDADMIVVPVGGGGLISGIACAAKHLKPSIKIVGVQSDWVVKKTNHTAERIPYASIADGIAVKSLGDLTKPLIDKYVDELVSVSEDEISDAIVKLLALEHAVVEGAGAAGIAAALAGKLPKIKGNTVFVICGSNIDVNVLSRLIDRSSAKDGRLLGIIVSVPDVPGALHLITEIISQQAGNILNVLHDRSFSAKPAYVDIEFTIEVKDLPHQKTIIDALEAEGLTVALSEHP